MAMYVKNFQSSFARNNLSFKSPNKPSYHFSHSNISKGLFFNTFLYASNLRRATPKRNTFVEKYLIEGVVSPPLEHTTPTFTNGLWYKPKLNNRKFKLLKQKAISQGLDFVDPRPVVEKKPNPENFQRKAGPKGHRWEEKKEKRLETIKKKMKDMPKLVDEYRAANKKKRELEVKPISLFWPTPILFASRRLAKRKSQEKIREERKQRRRDAKAQKRMQAEKDGNDTPAVKKKKDNKGSSSTSGEQLSAERKAESSQNQMQALFKKPGVDTIAILAARGIGKAPAK